MDRKPYLKLLETLDNMFNPTDYWGNNDEIDYLEDAFSKTHFHEKYLDVEDFISYHTSGINYTNLKRLKDQYSDVEIDDRLQVVEVLFNIIYFSELEEIFKKKVSSYLARYKIVFSDDLEYKKIISSGGSEYYEGSFGRVYLVDERFVKKQLKNEYWTDKDISSRFKNEYNIQKRLFDYNAKVLDVYDYDSTMNSFIMERADMDLYQLLDENKLIFDIKISIINQIIDTMEIAHQKKIIHRDLHPGNVMIKGRDVFVSDFGFAKDSKHLRSRLSTVSPKPTHKFLAPEGFSDFTKLDDLSDIYSIGKIIDYIMCDGNLGQPHSFRPLVEKCTKDERNLRFKNIHLLKEALGSIHDYYIKGVNIKEINSNIADGIHTIIIEEYLLKLAKDSRLASQIVANKWIDLSNIILSCSTENQISIIKAIGGEFVEATGYKGWNNYDIFARISYEVLISSDNMTVCKNAYSILKECAKIRFAADRLLAQVSFEKIQLIEN